MTPQKKKNELKSRLSKALEALPMNWISIFRFKFPDYDEMSVHLSNVGRGMSLDEDVIHKMEKLAKSLMPSKRKAA